MLRCLFHIINNGKNNNNKPKSKLATGNSSIAIIKAVAADCAPDAMVIDLQPSFIAHFTALQAQRALGIH